MNISESNQNKTWIMNNRMCVPNEHILVNQNESNVDISELNKIESNREPWKTDS